MAKLPWMKFFPADYLLDTQVLTPAARGIWMDLICHLWRAETRGELTYPTAIWEAILRCQSPHLTTILNELITHRICVVVTDGHNNVTVQSRRMLREENGRTGAMLRKRKQRVTPSCHSDVTPEKLEVRSQKLESEARNQISESESESEVRSQKKKELHPYRDQPRAVAEFELFWSAYPKRVGGKKNALRAWMKAAEKPPLHELIAAIDRARQTEQWKKDGGQYIPYPATWLNRGMWADDVKPMESAFVRGMNSFLERHKEEGEE